MSIDNSDNSPVKTQRVSEHHLHHQLPSPLSPSILVFSRRETPTTRLFPRATMVSKNKKQTKSVCFLRSAKKEPWSAREIAQSMARPIPHPPSRPPSLTRTKVSRRNKKRTCGGGGWPHPLPGDGARRHNRAKTTRPECQTYRGCHSHHTSLPEEKTGKKG